MSKTSRQGARQIAAARERGDTPPMGPDGKPTTDPRVLDVSRALDATPRVGKRGRR